MSELSTVFMLAGLHGSSFSAQRTIVEPNPAVATDFELVVPGGRAWVPLSLFFQLTTDANVANRSPDVTIEADNGVIARIPAAAVQAAGATGFYSLYVGGAGAGLAGTGVGAMPYPILMLPGYSINSAVRLLQAGDQLSGINLFVMEFTYPR